MAVSVNDSGCRVTLGFVGGTGANGVLGIRWADRWRPGVSTVDGLLENERRDTVELAPGQPQLPCDQRAARRVPDTRRQNLERDAAIQLTLRSPEAKPGKRYTLGAQRC